METIPPIHEAASVGCIISVRAMIQHDHGLVNVRHADGNYPIHYAVSGNRRKVAAYLLACGADINAKGRSDATPFLTACHAIVSSKDHTRMAEFLLSRGADLSTPCKVGRTPLMLLCASGSTELVATILDKLAAQGKEKSINDQDQHGLTALDHACAHRHVEVVRMLLEEGADPLKTRHAIIKPPRVSRRGVLEMVLLAKPKRRECLRVLKVRKGVEVWARAW